MTRTFAACIFFGTILFLFGPMNTLHIANAATVNANIVGGPGSQADIKSAAANELMSGFLGSLERKEYVLDEIAFMLAKAALQEITASVVDWINSGFEGDPAFVTNLEEYLTNVADEVAGNIIYGSELGFLCSPLELDVRLALEIGYQKSKDLGYNVQCTVSDVVSNVEDFYNGNFLAGGWPGWFEIVTKPQNNIYGATAIAQAHLRNDLIEAKEREEWTLNWGDGFLSWEECIDEAGGRPNCRTVTPGNVISEQLTFELSVGERTLIEADEFNEVINALLAQLGQQALQGVGGLFGLSGSGGGSGSSYTSQLRSTAGQPTSGPGGGGSGQALSFIAGAIADEREYRSIVQPVIDRAVSVKAQATQAGNCGSNNSIAASAESVRVRYQSEVTESLTTEATLQGMQFRYDAADADERLLIAQEFENLRTSGVMHTYVENVRVEFEAEEEMDALSLSAGRIRTCGSGGSNQNGNDRQ